MENKRKVLVVGAGFSGAVVARQLAEAGFGVTVIDKREHLAGNAFDFVDDMGIRVHKYGPHIFHTSNQQVADWVQRFAEWVPYKHKVKAMLPSGELVTLPVNRETAAKVGADRIIDIFFRPYTKKMWGLEIEEIDSRILQRVAIRDDDNEYYFPDDAFQAMPVGGYTRFFEKVLAHPNIELTLSCTYSKDMDCGYRHVFNSMPIDEYFDYSLGELPYRSIRFHTYTVPVPQFFPVATVNFTHTQPYTRVTEWKNFPGHGDNPSHTTLTVEEPCDYRDNAHERYYPVKDASGANQECYKRYLQQVPPNVTFIGRCGNYAYLDMHQAISSALAVARKFLAGESSGETTV